MQYYPSGLPWENNFGASEYTFHNAEGYVKYSPNSGIYKMCYYVRDHLGNICAVWDTEELRYRQRMWYYPSGVPMYISSGQLVQPMKYNGKPYEETEGFDVFDYGFRGYYATIMRFTSIDPLAEETPWQSPYAYAANGINIMAGTGSVLAATILFGTGVGEIITVGVTAYAVMDIGCGWITGQSLSNHLDKRWGSWNF